MGAFDKQAIQVDIAATEQRIMAALARRAQRIRRALVRFLIITEKRVALFFQRLYHFRPVGRALRLGNFGTPCRKPFDLLQLYPVPWRIADNGIKAAFALCAAPMVPNAGKGDLPIQETLFGDQLPGLFPYLNKPLQLFGLCAWIIGRFLAACNRQGIAKLTVQPQID